MRIDEITSKLKGVKRSQDGFVAKCPGHDDEKGSLTVRASGGKVQRRELEFVGGRPDSIEINETFLFAAEPEQL